VTAKGTISDFQKREVDDLNHRKDGVNPESGSPHFILAVQVFNPFHRFGVGDLSKVALGGREI
jgi:hypothetical protein